MPTPQAMKPLPVEILDLIFYFLRDDIPGLRACADIDCFADIVEKHLYHHVTLGDSDSMLASRLSKLLEDSPHIITYIKSLSITLSPASFIPWLLKHPPREKEFAAILPRLQHLTALSLKAAIDSHLNWPGLHRDFQASVLAHIRSQTLTDLSISGVRDFPLALLHESPQLRRLSLNGPFSTAGLSSKAENYPDLRDLTLENSVELVEWLDRTNITTLRSLVMRILPNTSRDCIPGILSNSSESLTYLELRSFYESWTNNIYINSQEVPSSARPLDLSVTPHLQHLYFGAEFFSSQNFWISSDGQEKLENQTFSTPTPWITETLQTLFKISTIQLQSIILDITFRIHKSDYHQVSWGPLVETLERLRSLRKVELRVRFKGRESWVLLDHDSWGIEELRRDVHLARLIESGVLVIKEQSTRNARKGPFAAL